MDSSGIQGCDGGWSAAGGAGLWKGGVACRKQLTLRMQLMGPTHKRHVQTPYPGYLTQGHARVTLL